VPEPADRLVVTLSDDWLRDVTTEVRQQAVTAMLLERERELAVLRQSLDEARTGRGRIVIVEGPAGIGKTSLLRAAGDMAAQAGFTELRARASELEHDFAYGCVRQLFEPIIAKATATERQRLFGGAADAVRPLLVAGAASPQSPAADTSYAVLHGIYWFVNNLAEGGPVVALVDDVQWSDAESMRFLNYLAPRWKGWPSPSSRRHGVARWPTPIWPGWPAVPRRRSCVPAR
jgi:AAA ATPase domain